MAGCDLPKVSVRVSTWGNSPRPTNSSRARGRNWGNSPMRQTNQATSPRTRAQSTHFGTQFRSPPRFPAHAGAISHKFVRDYLLQPPPRARGRNGSTSGGCPPEVPASPRTRAQSLFRLNMGFNRDELVGRGEIPHIQNIQDGTVPNVLTLTRNTGASVRKPASASPARVFRIG